MHLTPDRYGVMVEESLSWDWVGTVHVPGMLEPSSSIPCPLLFHPGAAEGV